MGADDTLIEVDTAIVTCGQSRSAYGDVTLKLRPA